MFDEILQMKEDSCMCSANFSEFKFLTALTHTYAYVH